MRYNPRQTKYGLGILLIWPIRRGSSLYELYQELFCQWRHIQLQLCPSQVRYRLLQGGRGATASDNGFRYQEPTHLLHDIGQMSHSRRAPGVGKYFDRLIESFRNVIHNISGLEYFHNQRHKFGSLSATATDCQRMLQMRRILGFGQSLRYVREVCLNWNAIKWIL